MTARTMADSVSVDAMPAWVSVKAFYVDGKFTAPHAAITAWKGPRVLTCVTGDPAVVSNELDVETGDATPDHVGAWADAQIARGEKYLDIYCNRSSFAAVVANIGRRPVGVRLATLDGTVLHTFDGHPLVACQALPASMTGANFDLSLVWDDAWHPGWDTEVPNADLQDLHQLAAAAQTALGRLAGKIHSL